MNTNGQEHSPSPHRRHWHRITAASSLLGTLLALSGCADMGNKPIQDPNVKTQLQDAIKPGAKNLAKAILAQATIQTTIAGGTIDARQIKKPVTLHGQTYIFDASVWFPIESATENSPSKPDTDASPDPDSAVQVNLSLSKPDAEKPGQGDVLVDVSLTSIQNTIIQVEQWNAKCFSHLIALFACPSGERDNSDTAADPVANARQIIKTGSALYELAIRAGRP